MHDIFEKPYLALVRHAINGLTFSRWIYYNSLSDYHLVRDAIALRPSILFSLYQLITILFTRPLQPTNIL